MLCFSLNTPHIKTPTPTRHVDMRVFDKFNSKLAKKILHQPLRYLKLLQSGLASYYGLEFQGSKTASGRRFNTYELVAAHRYLPFGKHIRVYNPSTGKSVIVTIIDRGPWIYGRIIDLSLAAKRAIGMSGGLAYVKLYSQ